MSTDYLKPLSVANGESCSTFLLSLKHVNTYLQYNTMSIMLGMCASSIGGLKGPINQVGHQVNVRKSFPEEVG